MLINNKDKENKKKKKSKLQIKRNTPIEMIVFTLITIVVGIFTFSAIFSRTPENKTPQESTTPISAVDTPQPTGNISAGEDGDDPSLELPMPTPTEIISAPVQVASFPLTSKDVKNIEITSTTNGICNENNKWELKFFINNKNASLQKKYAYHIVPENGHAFVLYKGEIDPNEFETAVNFLYSEEYGNMSPIVYDGITWSPPIEPVPATKFFVKVIDIESRSVESCFNIIVQKDEEEYKITGLESTELIGFDKETLYNKALNYYQNKDESPQIENIDHAVVTLSPKIENDIYYINNIAYNGIDMRPILAVYIKYNISNLPFVPSQGCFILYFNKDTLEIIGEGKMPFFE